MLTVVERFAVGLGAVSPPGVTCGRGVSGYSFRALLGADVRRFGLWSGI